MAIPKPETNESYADFMTRGMTDEVMLAEYKDEKQRREICQKLWADYRSSDDKEAYDPAKALTESTTIERRILSVDDIELRVTDDDNPRITGYAAKFGIFTDLGWFREKIKAGAFDEALKTSDVRCLKNHDPNLILGRTTSKTLRLESNSVGLKFDNDMPDTTTGKDTREEIRRGDISGCSFSFTVDDEEWKHFKDKPSDRTIIKVGRLFDVGPVTYPAYPDTTVAARSLEALKKENTEHRTPNAEGEGKGENHEAESEVKEETEEQRAQRRGIEIGYKKCGRNIARYNIMLAESSESAEV